MMKYPHTRMRRLRSDDFIRRLVAESRLSPDDLVQPLFVHNEKQDTPAPSMPGICRLSMDGLWRACEKALRLGIPAVAVFPVVETADKDDDGTGALNPQGLIPRALGGIKERFPQLGTIADVALDPYTSHGHDGVLGSGGRVENDRSVAVLARQAVMLAQAGADIVAPSDMMDGRVFAIRAALENAGLTDAKILSYAAKYASAFYAPFRAALGSGGALGGKDKRDYQMHPANRREALLEMRLDLDEGADMLMVKPAMPYLDIVREAADAFDKPVLAYQVSGEYAMLHSLGGGDDDVLRPIVMETMLSFKRAGARAVLTYFAADIAGWLKG
ncbi:MAG: porphobilinogen synthase [Gammaproteobacteria bacterium]